MNRCFLFLFLGLSFAWGTGKRQCWKAIGVQRGVELRLELSEAKAEYERKRAEAEAVFEESWGQVLANPELFSERQQDLAKRAQNSIDDLGKPVEKLQKEIEEHDRMMNEQLAGVFTQPTVQPIIRFKEKPPVVLPPHPAAGRFIEKSLPPGDR